jgi:hypothetical protein
MNRTCDGNFFDFNDRQYYRCLYDGTILQRVEKICPRCGREIDARDQATVISVSTVVLLDLKSLGEVEAVLVNEEVS